MTLNSIKIIFEKYRKVYYQGDIIKGIVAIENKYELKHDSIELFMDGVVNLQYNLKNMSLMEAFYNPNKPIELTKQRLPLVSTPGKLAPGYHEFTFALPLKSTLDDTQVLYETYHGVYISIQYKLSCCVKRPFFFKDLQEDCSFLVEYDSQPIDAPTFVRQPVEFVIEPNNLTATYLESVPNFLIRGQLDSQVCLLNEPITGQLRVDRCNVAIRSIEIQLVRVESCGAPSDKDYCRNASEVQNIEICHGNILRGVDIGFEMILPRLYSCPSLSTNKFKIEFEINIVVMFDKHLAIHNFNILLMRSTLQPVSHKL